MKYKAHDYQQFATEFVLEHPYCGLILDMGLGKSVITLTALWDLVLDRFDCGRVLVQKKSTETILKEAQTLGLLDKDFKSIVLNMVKELKKTRRTMYEK